MFSNNFIIYSDENASKECIQDCKYVKFEYN